MAVENPLVRLVQDAEVAMDDSDDSFEERKKDLQEKDGNKAGSGANNTPIVFVRVSSAELTLLLDSIGDQKLYDEVMGKASSVTTIVQSYVAQRAEVDKILKEEEAKDQEEIMLVKKTLAKGLATRANNSILDRLTGSGVQSSITEAPAHKEHDGVQGSAVAGKAAETKKEVVSDDENPVASGDIEGQDTGAAGEIESPEKCASPERRTQSIP